MLWANADTGEKGQEEGVRGRGGVRRGEQPLEAVWLRGMQAVDATVLWAGAEIGKEGRKKGSASREGCAMGSNHTQPINHPCTKRRPTTTEMICGFLWLSTPSR